MATNVQISAVISTDTKRRLEQFAEAHGVKKGHLIEEALRHHLQALSELPADVIIPPSIVVGVEEAAEILRAVDNPPPPTTAMRALMAD